MLRLPGVRLLYPNRGQVQKKPSPKRLKIYHLFVKERKSGRSYSFIIQALSKKEAFSLAETEAKESIGSTCRVLGQFKRLNPKPQVITWYDD